MKTKVLVVDDNSDNLYLLKAIFEGQGWEVFEAQNGKTALKIARDQPPDLIVSDILMPVMDGYTLCRQCKSEEKLKNIPFVFYTATYTEPKDEKFTQDIGADRFIIKPEKPATLIKILIDVLEEKKRVKPGTAKPLGEEMEFFRRHNEILFSKLEKKMSDLETLNQELKTVEEQYRLSFEHVSDVIFTLDKDLKILNISSGMEKVLGYKPQDLIGRSIADVGPILTPQSLEQGINHVSRIIKGETVPPSVYEFIAKDGTIKIGEVSGSPIMRDGNVSGIVAVARDITDRKRAEEALKKSEENFRNSLNNSIMGVRIVSDDGKTLYANQATLDLYGFASIDELKNTPVTKCYTKESLAENKLRREQRKRGGIGPMNYVISIIRKDGEIRHLEVFRKEILWDGVKRFQVLYNDITERKRAEEALRESEEKFRLISDQSLMAIGFIQDSVYKYVNQTYCDITGYTFAEIMKWHPNELMKTVHPDDHAFVMDQVEKKQSGNPDAVTHYQFRGLTKKQETIWLDLYSKTVTYKGKFADLVSFVDITESKRAEEALREGEELYRTIFDNTGTSMIFIEEDMTISMANDEFVRNTGYSSDEINGRMKWTEIIHPDDLGRMIEQHRLRREIKGGALPSYEFRYITKTGDIRDTFLTIKLVPGTKKSIASLIDITERKQAEEYLRLTLDNVNKAVSTTIHVLAAAVEARDPYTAGHQTRAADLARAIAEEMGFPREKINGILMAGSIHDIGKLSVPAEILTKSSKLTNIEFSLIMEHAQKGHEMLMDVESPWALSEMVYQHHERMDGSGYPRNLKNGDILIEARILAVADVVEAMASHRPYRPSLGVSAALEEIEKNKGILYDNDVADACLKLFREKGYVLREASAHN